MAALWPSKLPSYDGKTIAFWCKRLPQVHVPVPGPGISHDLAQPPVGTKTYQYSFPVRKVPRASVILPRATVVIPTTNDYRLALRAIRAMGTNALPYLFQKLDPPPRLANLASRSLAPVPAAHSLIFASSQVGIDQAHAVTGLLALCPLPPDAVQKLRVLSVDFKGHVWPLAGDILRANEDPKLLQEILGPYQ